VEGKLRVQNLITKPAPFKPKIPPHHERDIENKKGHNRGIQQRFSQELANTPMVIEIALEERFQLAGSDRFRTALPQFRPALLASGRREFQGQLPRSSRDYIRINNGFVFASRSALI
jgi:hypothetical protein